MTGILTLLGFMGVIVSLVILLVNVIRKKPNKKVSKIFWICFVVMVISFIMVPTSDDKEVSGNETKITKYDIKMFKKKYEDLSKDERIRLITIEKDMTDEERDSYKDEFKRLYIEEMGETYSSVEAAEEIFEKNWDYNTRKRKGELTEEEKVMASSKNKPTKSIRYEIIEKNDISYKGAKRYSWEVVVKNIKDTNELKELSREIVELAKEEEFNAIAICFYDYEEYVGHGYTLGRVEYAPGGDWEKANTVQAGDYENMDYKFDLRKKNWDKQLTEEEVKIYKSWKDLYERKLTEDVLVDEDEVKKEISIKYNISEEEVYNIMIKQMMWMLDIENE